MDSLLLRIPGWLVPQFKLIALKRLRELLKKTGFCRDCCRHLGSVTRPAVAAVVFDVMQGCICFEFQFMQRFAILRIEADARTHCRVKRMTTDRKRTSHILEQRREQGVEFVVVTFRHQQDKSVSSQPCQGHLTREPGSDALCNGDQ